MASWIRPDPYYQTWKGYTVAAYGMEGGIYLFSAHLAKSLSQPAQDIGEGVYSTAEAARHACEFHNGNKLKKE